MRNSRILFSLLLVTLCFGRLGNVNLKPLPGMQFVNHAHRFGRSLAGMWEFNDRPLVTGTTYDLSGNGNHGTLVGDVHSVPGEDGFALTFDQSGDYVTLANDSVQFGTSDFTIIAGVTQNSDSTNKTVIATKNTGGPGSAAGFAFSLTSANRFSMNVDNGIGGSSEIGSGLPAALLSTGYHVIAGVFRSGISNTIYADGVFIGQDTSSIPSTSISNANTSKIGAFANNALQYAGDMHFVHAYSRALDASEISSLYADKYQIFRQERLPIASVGAPPAEVGQLIMVGSVPLIVVFIAFSFWYSGRKCDDEEMDEQ